MSEVDDFLSLTMPRLMDAERALHNGDAGPRLAMWSENEPVTLFGAWFSDVGRDDVSRVFTTLASRFSECTEYDVEMVAAGTSGDLAYTVAYEHTKVSVEGDPRQLHLRVSQIYRREQGEWKPVHRHGDEVVTDRAR